MLTGPEQIEWIDALSQAFSPEEFANLLFHRLNDRVTNYAGLNANARDAIGAVVDAYSRRDEEERLIAKAVEARPANAKLLRLARQRRAAEAPTDLHLERFVRESNSFLEMTPWLEKAGAVQVRVCRIEIQGRTGTSFGTGFLVGPDLVMTNYHVMQPVIATEDNDTEYRGLRAAAGDVKCRFDYKVFASGVVNYGSVFALAPNWRVVASPNNPRDREPTADELDVAIIRLDRPAGALPVGDAATPSGDPRGWVELPRPDVRPDFAPHSPLLIVQHPKGEPLKLALDFDSIQSVNAARTRVRHSTNTERGSSGSPCFNQNWELIALHHAGDPDFDAPFNEAIPIDAITSYFVRHAIAGVLGAGV